MRRIAGPPIAAALPEKFAGLRLIPITRFKETRGDNESRLRLSRHLRRFGHGAKIAVGIAVGAMDDDDGAADAGLRPLERRTEIERQCAAVERHGAAAGGGIGAICPG